MEGLQNMMGILEKYVNSLKEIIPAADNSAKKDITPSIRQTVTLLHQISQYKILQAADKLLKGSVFEDPILPEAKEIPMPKEGEHDFHLGDWVKVKFSYEHFKSVVAKSDVWQTCFSMALGQVGTVTRVMSKHDNIIQVYFPEVYLGFFLHVIVLEKVECPEMFPGRWQVGEIVKAISDPQLVNLFQRGIDKLPGKCLGSKGRVTAVTRMHILVTFDEKESIVVFPGVLEPSDDATPIKQSTREHARGFSVGERAKMIRNVKKMVQNQEDKGGWNTEMSHLIGNEVTIVDIREDGTINVQSDQKRSWRVNSDSVLKIDEPHQDFPHDFEFIPGDIVKIRPANNLRLILNVAGIPLSFLEYLRCPAKIECMDEKLRVFLLFHVNHRTEAKVEAIRKVTPAELENYKRVQNAVGNLKKDDIVHLDIGPPNYVRDVLAATKVDAAIRMVMTKSAKLKGFTGPDHAVIEYSNGKQYKINKKYLTVPEKFYITEPQEGIDLDAIQQIKNVVSNYVYEVHNREETKNEDWKVEVLSMSSGAPPSVEIKVHSLLVDPDKVYSWLSENSGWDIKPLCGGHMLVRGITGHPDEVKVAIFFNDEELGISKTGSGVSRITMSTIQEGGQVDAAAEPMEPAEGRQRTEVQQPVVADMRDFKYIHFSDPSLAQDVYLPYILHGPRHTPVQPVHDPQQPQARQIIYNITTVDTILS